MTFLNTFSMVSHLHRAPVAIVWHGFNATSRDAKSNERENSEKPTAEESNVSLFIDEQGQASTTQQTNVVSSQNGECKWI